MSWERIFEAVIAAGARIADALGAVWASYSPELLLAGVGLLIAWSLWQARATVRLRADLESEVRRSEYWQKSCEISNLDLLRSLRALEGQFESLSREHEAARLRGSRVDFTVARSLARTGANCSQLEDCGLSLGEAQLVTALHGRAAASAHS